MTSLALVVCDICQMVTMQERVYLTLGIACAVECFHDHLTVAHGLASSANVFVTQQLRARTLNPPEAYILTGNPCEQAATLANDIRKVFHLLPSLLSDIFACDHLLDIAVGVESWDRNGDCKSLFKVTTA